MLFWKTVTEDSNNKRSLQNVNHGDLNAVGDEGGDSDMEAEQKRIRIQSKRSQRPLHTRFTSHQLGVLHKAFKWTPYPDTSRRKKLAQITKLSEHQIYVRNMIIPNSRFCINF